MIIDCISDLHGHYPLLEGGDLLIVAGDLTARDEFLEHIEFNKWLYEQKYKKKIVIAGNHDNHFKNIPSYAYVFSSYNEQTREQISYADYLCDSGTEFEGLKIFGSPWTRNFFGQNPECKAFGLDFDHQMEEKWEMIPKDIDILVTHSPPYGIQDKILARKWENNRVGCQELLKKVLDVRPKLHVFGHIHEGYGQYAMENGPIFVNASHVNENYEPINKPIRIIL